MKRLLRPLLASLALPTAINANVAPEVHNLCKDVSDYVGCVKANSKKKYANPFKKSSKEKTNGVNKTTKVKNQRPCWMAKKIKDCLKFVDEKQKNFCIKTYSPYGNPIPENSDSNCSTSTLKYSPREVFFHKNKTYTASKVCPEGQKMYWVITGLFKKKVSEMGCMTSEQFKIAKMEMEIKGLKRAIRTNALNDASNSINNMIQQQQINTNQYNSTFGY